MNENIKKLKNYKGFDVFLWSEGFEKYILGKEKAGSLGKFDFGSIAKIVVRKEDLYSSFAFAVSGLDMVVKQDNPEFTEENLLDMAVEAVERYINQNRITKGKELTFELHTEFTEVEDPAWWTKSNV